MKKTKLSKILSLLLVAVLTCSVFSACSKKADNSDVNVEMLSEEDIPENVLAQFEEQKNNEASSITVVDQIGREVVLEKKAEKIVSSYYISSAILVALGLEDNIVGIEAKADTRGLYSLAAPNLIDLPAIGSGKGVNVEEIASLNPDLVIIPKKLSDSVASFEELNIPVLVVNPERLEDFESCIELLSAATGTETKGDALLSYYSDKLAEIDFFLTDIQNKPDVYLASGSDYFSTCTNQMYQNYLIALAGGNNVSKELTEGYWQTVSAEQLNLWQPEYIFAVNYAEYSLDDIRSDSTLSEVPAVKNDKIYSFPSAIEPWDYPTPSSILGVLYLTHTLHPDVYSQEEYINEATYFYKEFFDIDITLEHLGL